MMVNFWLFLICTLVIAIAVFIRLAALAVEVLKGTAINPFAGLDAEELEQIGADSNPQHAKLVILHRKMVPSSMPGVGTFVLLLAVYIGALNRIDENLSIILSFMMLAALCFTSWRAFRGADRAFEATSCGPARRPNA